MFIQTDITSSNQLDYLFNFAFTFDFFFGVVGTFSTGLFFCLESVLLSALLCAATAGDALAALELFPELKQTEEYQILLENFQNHAGNLSLWQSEEDGRWHNIIKGKNFSIYMQVQF